MGWRDLAFLHWRLPAADIEPHIPDGLTLDTFGGDAWLGVVPFRMEDVRLRLLPPVPSATNFPELNVRTYVRAKGRAGVWFFSLDAGSRLAVRVARLSVNLPYFHATMTAARSGEVVTYRSRRNSARTGLGVFNASYRPVGPVYEAEEGSLDHWLTERYTLFGRLRTGQLYHLDIQHHPWPLQRAEARIETNTMAEAASIVLPLDPPLVLFSASQDVVAWPPKFL